ncbi:MULTISPECIES: LysR family transcriptional regulator [Gammaproteobacteria]|uniref:Transcriptional regulator n=1 Tax=Xanthomonas boreopolis TaxID=86183 RepID=A0A919KHK7_9XANT|nr:LysR family transcriptional regulator [Pseudomonas sp. Hp2]GHH52773.1 transcriptional regulator [[Pseudomonas] boreopolis]
MTSPLPPLAALRAFEAAARLGSVSRAADELHVTHGAVSRHVRTLEQALGTALFAKAGRGLALTPAGERLREAASEAFAQLGDAWTQLRRLPAETPLVLGCSGSLLARWLIPRLGRLEQALPAVRLHLSAREQAPEPHLPGLDAMLLLAAPPWPSEWQVSDLGPERIGPVLSPHHPDVARLVGSAPQRLLDYPLLHTRSRPQAWPDWAAAHGMEAAALRHGSEFEHLLYLLEAAVAGLGIAIAPQPLVSEDLATGRLIAPWGFVETPARWALCRLRRNPDPRVERLARWFREELER